MNAPFFLSTGLSVLCVLLSFLSFGKSQTNNGLQAELLKKQAEIQDLTQVVTLQDQDFKRQTEIINTGAQVAQKLGPPILRDMGYLAAKNKNEKIKALLIKQKLENFIPNDEQLKQMDKQLDEIRANKGQPAKDPAGAAVEPTPPAMPAPALRSTPAK